MGGVSTPHPLPPEPPLDDDDDDISLSLSLLFWDCWDLVISLRGIDIDLID